tara:strand:- start:610 stop:1242 length:633 start_codon:yes stop_codon:yes gene_type:complete
MPLTSSQKHKIIKNKQKKNCNSVHHPKEKILQLENYKKYFKDAKILEVFGGEGNLTKYYNQFGNVTALTKEKFGSSFDYIYKLRADKKKYNIIDIDSYGYPDLFFPVVFEMIKDNGLLIFTFPVVGVNCLNGIQEQHFITFWKNNRPSIGNVTGVLTDMALRYWIVLELKDVVKINRIYRFIYKCKKRKATLMTNTKNNGNHLAKQGTLF